MVFGMRRGRPPGGSAKKAGVAHEVREKQLCRVSVMEYDDIRKSAAERGMPISDLIVETLRAAGLIRSRTAHDRQAARDEREREAARDLRESSAS